MEAAISLCTYAIPIFGLSPRCEYQQTSPESHFTQNRICSLLTPNGRISVSDTRFIVSENGARRERAVNDEKDYAELLRERFGIVM
jgi:N-hydroxyarylamine O-acetyltransferase